MFLFLQHIPIYPLLLAEEPLPFKTDIPSPFGAVFKLQTLPQRRKEKSTLKPLSFLRSLSFHGGDEVAVPSLVSTISDLEVTEKFAFDFVSAPRTPAREKV